MNRWLSRGIVLVLALLIVGGAAFGGNAEFRQSGGATPGSRQDANLEATVADLEVRVSILETAAAGGSTATPVAATPIDTGVTTVTGTGTELTEPFQLPAGAYRVTITYTVVEASAFFGLSLVDAAGNGSILFSAAAQTGEFTGSKLVKVEGGTFFLQSETSGTTTWKVEFAPLNG